MNNGLYYFSDNVRVLKESKGFLIIRKGVWNYEDLIISIEDSYINELSKVFNSLSSDEGIDLIQIKNDRVKNIVKELINSGFVNLNEFRRNNRFLNYLYLGQYLEGVPQEKPYLLISDDSSLINVLETTAKSFDLKYEFLSQENLEFLKTPVFLNKLDLINYSKSLDYFRSKFMQFEGVILLLGNLNPFLLRNINRILIGLNKPIFFGTIDGPFMLITCLEPKRTACIECYEQRIIARMTDHVLYHRFNKEYEKHKRNSKLVSLGDFLSPAYYHIAYILVGDAFTFFQVKTSKLMGRALHIYVPFFEFQNQDVLRISSCPACGYLSTYKSRCLNIETQKLVSTLISNSN